MNEAKLAAPRHSEQLQWEKIGKVVNGAKLAVLSHSEPFLVGKDWKSCESGKIGCSESSESLQWGKVGKVVNWAKLAIPSHSEPLQWEKIEKKL